MTFNKYSGFQDYYKVFNVHLFNHWGMNIISRDTVFVYLMATVFVDFMKLLK